MPKTSKTIYPLLAKVGHKLKGDKYEQAQTLWEHFYDEDIETYEQNRLSTIQDILDPFSYINDIVMLEEVRKYSCDYDYKRNLLEDGSTVPHKDMNEFHSFRGVVQNLRDKKHLRATFERVAFYQYRAKQNVRMVGSNQKDVIRHFLRALVQEVYPFTIKYSYIDITKKLREYNVTVDQLKNARRFPFVANIISNSSSSRSLIRKLLKRLNYTSENKYQEWINLLIFKGLSNPVTMYE